MRAGATQCRDRLRRDGVDFTAYSAGAVVGDAEQLRRALGIERWDLLGISYGTRVALAYQSLAPGGAARWIRSPRQGLG